MRKILTWVSTACLLCLATILLVLIASYPIAQINTETEAASQSSLVMIGDSFGHTRQFSVFEAVVDNSYEIFLSDDLAGQTWQLTTHFGNDRFPVLSPDGGRVAFVSWRDGNSEIYVIELASGVLRNVSNHPGQDVLPASAWSPDGTMLAHASRRNNNFEISLADVTRGLAQNLTKSPHHDSQPVWLPDGHQVVFTSDRHEERARFVFDLGGRN